MAAILRLDGYAMGEITDLLEGAAIARMWLCGCRALHHKFAVGGVRTFSIVSSIAFKMPWPRITAYFSQLRTFRLVSHAQLIKSIVSDINFMALSTSLSRIEVSFDQDDLHLYHAFTTAPERFLQLDTVILREANNRGQVQRPIRGGLVRVLPRNVSTFIVKRDTSDATNPYREPIHKISPNLAIFKTFNLNLYPILPHPSPFANLLSFSTTMNADKWMEALPATLQELKLNYIRDAYLLLIPRGLIKLTVTDAASTSALIAALPHTLTSLKVTRGLTLTLADMLLLPRRLVDLSSSSLYHTLIDADMAAAMPRSLTGMNAYVQPSALPHLPTGFTTLVLAYLNDVNSRSLPPALTRLVVHGGEIIPSCIFDLPRSLHTLAIRASGGSVVYSPSDYISLLPSELRILHLALSTQMLMTARTSRDLPRTLEDLTLGPIIVMTDWYVGLPPTLTYLILNVSTFGIDEAVALSSSQSQLRCLQITVASHWDYRALAHMPRTLHSLSINVDTRCFQTMPSSGDEEGDVHSVIALLPPIIATLNIPLIGWRDLQDMRDWLPPTLVCFMFDKQAPGWFTPLPQRPRRVFKLGPSNWA